MQTSAIEPQLAQQSYLSQIAADTHHFRHTSDESDWKHRCSRRILLAIFLFVAGAVLIGISIGTVIKYNEWKNATPGQCQYVEAVAVECRGTRNCRGWQVGHVYAVDNTTEAYTQCARVTFMDEQDSCLCDSANTVEYETPDNADNAWHECHVTACDSVSFESIHTKSEYSQSAVLLSVGVVFVCALCGVLVWGKRRKKLEEDESVEKPADSDVEMQAYNKKDGPQEPTVATASQTTTATTTTATSTATVSTNQSMLSACLEMETANEGSLKAVDDHEVIEVP